MKKKKPKTEITRRGFSSSAHLSRVLACLLLFLTSSVLSQSRERLRPSDYALIFGTVWGPDDRPVPGMKVKIRRADQNKAHWEIYSDHNGEFAQRLPAGKADYLVWADLKGYKSPGGKELHQPGEVRVHVENDEREDVGLHLKQ